MTPCRKHPLKPKGLKVHRRFLSSIRYSALPQSFVKHRTAHAARKIAGHVGSEEKKAGNEEEAAGRDVGHFGPRPPTYLTLGFGSIGWSALRFHLIIITGPPYKAREGKETGESTGGGKSEGWRKRRTPPPNFISSY